MYITIDEIDDNSLTSIINHVFLPPKLPQKGEINHNIEKYNEELLRLCTTAAQNYRDRQSWEVHSLWEPAVRMLENFSYLHNPSFLDSGAFSKTVKQMETGGEIKSIPGIPPFIENIYRTNYVFH